MLNLIPRFIHDKYKDGEVYGCFEGISVFIDIVGFTALTGGLMKRGKEGAEVISNIINRLYTPLIKKVYRAGGFVSVFAGDSFTALFPSGNMCYIKNMALAIQSNIESMRNIFDENNKGHDLNIRIGISSGEVDWGIVGTTRKAFYFKGKPITESALVIKTIEPGNIAIYGENSKKLMDDKSCKVKEHTYTGIRASRGRMRHSILEEFVPDHLPEYEMAGEFRDVTAVFTAFRTFNNHEDIDNFISKILTITGSLGGYPNGLFFDDKGPHMLTLFGAPKSYENNLKRALDYTMKLRNEFGSNVKSGLSRGIAYVGIVGSQRRCTYTSIGDKVNISARLMSNADWDSILISGELETQTAKWYKTAEFASLILKGITNPVSTYNVISPLEVREPKLFEGETVGREREITILEEHCKTIWSAKWMGRINRLKALEQ